MPWAPQKKNIPEYFAFPVLFWFCVGGRVSLSTAECPQNEWALQQWNVEQRNLGRVQGLLPQKSSFCSALWWDCTQWQKMSFVKSRKEGPGSCSFPWATVSAHFAASAGIIIEASVSTNALVAAVRGVRSSNSWASNSGKDQVLLGIPRTSPLQNICDCLSRDWLGVSLCHRDFETSGIAETYCLRWSSVARAHHQDEPHHLSLPPFVCLL